MFPVIVSFGPLTLYSFGLLAAIGMLAGLFLYWRTIHTEGYAIEQIIDSAVIAVLAGLFSARLWFIALHPAPFWPNFWRAFDIFNYGGFIWYGGLTGGVIALVWYSRKHRLATRKLLDAAAISVSFGHAIGLLGAFLAGSSYGDRTNFFWGVPMVGLDGKRHPVQLLELFVELSIFSFLVIKMRKKYTPGIIGLLYIIAYATSRIFIEFLRGDSVYWFGIKSQWFISLVILLLCFIYWLKRFGGVKFEPKHRVTNQIV